MLAGESRARNPDATAARVACNAARLAADPEAREAKRASDRAYRHRMRDDPDYIARKREREHAYRSRMSADPAWRERRRLHAAEARAEKERQHMLRDMETIGGRNDDD